MKIHKTARTDEIGHDNGWSMWECIAEFSDGTIRHGFVQGDEHSTAEETLELLPEETEKDRERHPNGAPKWSPDGKMLLDDQGNRSIFDDVDL